MYRVKDYVIPKSVEECGQLLQSNRRSRLIAGNLFLRMTSVNIPLAIDLSGCGLDYIHAEPDGTLRLGAMCSLRMLETSPLVQRYCGGILSRSVGEIIGVQFRTLATVGASVFSKYGFSDVITPLLACNARVRLFSQGELSLEEFLKQPRTRDLLLEVILPPGSAAGAFANFRNSKGDFSILNVASVRTESGYRIAVGARPMCAALAYGAMDRLAADPAAVSSAARTAAEELHFGSNLRASEQYRRTLCEVLCERTLSKISEVRL